MIVYVASSTEMFMILHLSLSSVPIRGFSQPYLLINKKCNGFMSEIK